jgi:hypothetical protein
MLEHALVPNAGNVDLTGSPPSSGKSQGSTLDTSDRFPKPGDPLLEWLTRGATFRSLGLAHNQIWIRGFGPWANDDLANFLSLRGFNVVNVPTPIVSVLVLGRYDYGEDTIFEIIAETCAGPLYVFSQEMLLAWMVSKRDPYIDATEE